MATTLDPYRDWLGIAETARPLNHYQLLRLKQFEDDPGKVRDNYRKMNAHVRKFGSGEFAKQSQDVLNELAKAMLCLTDATRKGEYDASLGRVDRGPGKRRTLEEILLAQKVIDPNQLARARSYANAIGLEVRDALVQQKLARPEVVMPAYAESLGLPYLDLSDMAFPESVIRQVPAVLARQHSCAPVLEDDKQLLVASPNMLAPEVEEELRLRTGKPVRLVLCTAAGINSVIERHYSREVAAAEMAAGAGAQGTRPAAAKAAAGATAGAGPPKTAQAVDEHKKRQRDFTLVAFNFTFGIVTLVAFQYKGFLLSFGAGLLAGGIVAAIVWNVMGKKK